MPAARLNANLASERPYTHFSRPREKCARSADPAAAGPGFPESSDISPGVIHGRAKRPRTARRSEVVNNSAVCENSIGVSPASARSRSPESYRKTVTERQPGEPEALASTSNRTKPLEGCYISSMDGRVKGRRKPKTPNKVVKPSEQTAEDWLTHRAFGALDWASEKHNVVMVD